MTALAEELFDLLAPQIRELVQAEIREHVSLYEFKPWMTTDEAGEYLSLSSAAVRQRAKRGTIPAHKDDAERWIFNRLELDQHLTQNATPRARDRA